MTELLFDSDGWIISLQEAGQFSLYLNLSVWCGLLGWQMNLGRSGPMLREKWVLWSQNHGTVTRIISARKRFYPDCVKRLTELAPAPIAGAMLRETALYSVCRYLVALYVGKRPGLLSGCLHCCFGVNSSRSPAIIYSAANSSCIFVITIAYVRIGQTIIISPGKTNQGAQWWLCRFQ